MSKPDSKKPASKNDALARGAEEIRKLAAKSPTAKKPAAKKPAAVAKKTEPVGAKIDRLYSLTQARLAYQHQVEAKIAEMKAKFSANEIPLPSFWGGYRVTPQSFEFWQGRPSRLHDRFRYERLADGQWKIDRLMP